MTEKISSNTSTYEKLSSSYLIKQVKEIDRIKKHIYLLTIVEKILSDMGMRNNKNRKKILEYMHIQNKLEKDFSDILRQIASTIVFEEDFETSYLQQELTQEQLEKIKAWDILESKKRWHKERGKEIPDVSRKQLEKSKKSVYQSFL